MSLCQFCGLAKDAGAVLEMGFSPVTLGLPCRRGRAGYLFGADETDAADHLARGGLQDVGWLAETLPAARKDRIVPHCFVQPRFLS